MYVLVIFKRVFTLGQFNRSEEIEERVGIDNLVNDPILSCLLILLFLLHFLFGEIFSLMPINRRSHRLVRIVVLHKKLLPQLFISEERILIEAQHYLEVIISFLVNHFDISKVL